MKKVFKGYNKRAELKKKHQDGILKALEKHQQETDPSQTIEFKAILRARVLYEAKHNTLLKRVLTLQEKGDFDWDEAMMVLVIALSKTVQKFARSAGLDISEGDE